jgi:hypothetical protein
MLWFGYEDQKKGIKKCLSACPYAILFWVTRDLRNEAIRVGTNANLDGSEKNRWNGR